MSTFAQVKSTIKLNEAKLKALDKLQMDAMVKAADATLTDLKDSQTMPFDTGNLQNDSTFIEKSQVAANRVSIVTSTPYARRLYYHPEYNFRKNNNGNAGGKWFEPYKQNNFIRDAFKKFFKGGL